MPYSLARLRRPRYQAMLPALAFIASLSLLLTACSNSHDSNDTSTSQPLFDEAPTGEAFYLPPDPLVGENGDVLWVEPLDDAQNGKISKMLYRSENLRGEPMVVSGWIAVPNTPAPEGGYPVLSFAHGTTGMADACAPTIYSTPHETIALLEGFLQRGFVVAATDYEGLGTPGIHPYIIGTSEAHTVLDAARAAQRLAGGGSDVILFGHSQGGHAVVFANELATSYAPELNILGTVGSGSGVADSDGDLLEYLKTSPFKGFIVMTGVAHNVAFGDIESPNSRWFTPYGIEAAQALDTICVDEVSATYGPLDGDAIFVPGAPLPMTSDRYDPDAHTRPGLRVGISPMLMIHGRDDSLIPPTMLHTWAQATCELGQTIQLEWFDTGHRVPYEAPELAAPVVFDWIEDRFAGLPPPSNCDALPTHDS